MTADFPNQDPLSSPRDPTQRFSTRVANYLLYRPRYPTQIVNVLKTEGALKPETVIPDVGSGTGFLAELFLVNGNRVYGIEPNKEMREAGERVLQSFSNFVSIAGNAEATTLPDASVDLITAGQAFHWFDRRQCRIEFQRILRPGGWVALVWNDRRIDSTPFQTAYEKLLQRYATDYSAVDHKHIDAAVVGEFFGAEPIKKTFPNYQQFDFAGLQGRLLSSSYVPESGQEGYSEMLAALRDLYDEHQEEGGVTIEYDTLLYFGQLK